MRRLLSLATGLLLVGVMAAPVLAQEPEPQQEQEKEKEKQEEKKIRRHPDIISAEEIAERKDLATAADAVRRLRPSFTRIRQYGGPASTMDPIRVYVDGIRAGDVSALTNIQIAIVKEIRKLSAPDATTRFGTGHASGAIMVTTIHAKGPPG